MSLEVAKELSKAWLNGIKITNITLKEQTIINDEFGINLEIVNPTNLFFHEKQEIMHIEWLHEYWLNTEASNILTFYASTIEKENTK